MKGHQASYGIKQPVVHKVIEVWIGASGKENAKRSNPWKNVLPTDCQPIVQDHELGSPHTEPHPKNGLPTQIKDDKIYLLETVSESDETWNLRMLEPPRALVVISPKYVANGKTLTQKRK